MHAKTALAVAGSVLAVPSAALAANHAPDSDALHPSGKLTHDEELVEEVARRCTEVESGARNVDNILTNTLLPEISRRILARMAERQKIAPIHVSLGSDGAFVYN